MDTKFEQLLTAKIKRLGKSTTVLSTPTFSSYNKVGLETVDPILTSNSHTDHPEAVKIGDKNFYIADFGKVYTGETFRGLIILSNKNRNYALNYVEMTVYCTYQNKSSTKTLASKTIPKIDKGGNFYQIIELVADSTDSYVIEIKTRYRSEFFNDQLKSWNIDSMTPSQKSKFQSRDNYKIDYANKEVIRNFSKKFKFQTRSPFTVSPYITVRKNKYFLEMSLENESTQLFLQSVQL